MQDLVEKLGGQLVLFGWNIATAESCTGGMIAEMLTEISGASNYFDRGFITYSNAAKTEMLGVPADIIEKYGAVSPEVAHAMLDGALTITNVDVAISVTGVAGPTGGTKEKPVGLVFIGTALRKGHRLVTKNYFVGDRQTIRENTTKTALLQTLALVTDPT